MDSQRTSDAANQNSLLVEHSTALRDVLFSVHLLMVRNIFDNILESG